MNEMLMHARQPTGIRDANGQMVHEGDILDFDPIEWGEEDFRSVVTWDATEARWDWGGGTTSDVPQWRRVVGTIYQPADEGGQG